MEKAESKILDLVGRYRAFHEANRKAVRNLNDLTRKFTSIQAATIRRNEPFRHENIKHRCEKKRRVRGRSREISRRIFRDIESVYSLIEAFESLTGTDVSPYRSRAAEIREAFLKELWYLMKVVVHSLVDDTSYLMRQKETIAFLTEIRKEVQLDLLAHRQVNPGELKSFNEIARTLHQLGDEWFFERVRKLGAVQTIALENRNELQVCDLNAVESEASSWSPDDPATWPAPALTALVRPYQAGSHGAGQETLHVVMVDGLIDTQFTLGLHKARLRSKIIEGDASHNNFISLSYYEPQQTVYSQNIGKRLRYFSGLLERMDFSTDTDYVSYLNASFTGHSSLAQATLSEVMRAIISLKDLDEVGNLTDGYGFLLDLFQKGVTNLHNYLNARKYFRQFLAGKLDEDAYRTILISQRLNPQDLKVLFEDEIPALLQSRRWPDIEIPRVMKYVESLSQELGR